MSLDHSLCYRVLGSRDARFDGRFFIGVRTTGVYCRPICPAPTPKRENVEFFACAAAAEAAGFRPCRRCRPESSPGAPAWNGSSAVVSRALRLIEAGALDGEESDALAARVGLGERQLRRLFGKHFGASPAEVARGRRVHFAKSLIDETALSMTQVALSAGFQSIRQFNHAIRATFGRSPSEMRRLRRGATINGHLALRLAYRPPLDWRMLMDFYRQRATPGVESVDGETYRRTITLGDAAATLEVSPVAGKHCVSLRMDPSNVSDLIDVVARVRRMFDLNADPLRIAATLGDDPFVGEHAKARPGLRVPGAWDGFELAVRAVLGQQVSVRAATTLAGRLAARFGRPIGDPHDGLTHVFPQPDALADTDLTSIGLTTARAATIRGLARAVATGALRLDAALGLEDAVVRLTALPGVGEWTAQYVAMRAFGEPDAFPAGDLGLRRALANGHGMPSAKALSAMAEKWRPWRAYAAVHLWTAERDTLREKLS